MSYLSKRKNAGPKWIGLTDAVVHIQQVINGDANSAMHELKTALSDGVLSARFGADFDPDRPNTSISAFVADHSEVIPPNFWSHCLMFTTGQGFVSDQDPFGILGGEGGLNFLRRRTLHIDRHKLIEIWPTSDGSFTAIEQENVSSVAPAKTKPPVASVDQIRAALVAVYQEQPTPPNVEEAYQLAKARLKSEGKKAPRRKVRPVLKEPQFASQRLTAGSRKKP